MDMALALEPHESVRYFQRLPKRELNILDDSAPKPYCRTLCYCDAAGRDCPPIFLPYRVSNVSS